MPYKHVLKPLLFKLDPEYVHDCMTAKGDFFGNHALTRAAIDALYNYRGPDISTTVDGIRYRTPFLLSAGFDYNGRLSRILPHIGLGGEEIGSVTSRPCAGNPRPRLARLPKSQSILVNKGLRNDGVEKIIERLKKSELKTDIGEGDVRARLARARGIFQQKNIRAPEPMSAGSETPISQSQASSFILGISIARTNDPLSVPVQAGIDDYAYTYRRLNEENVGDYYTLNISCPNAFGAEAFNEPALLRRLLTVIKLIPSKKPLYVKMPINIPWAQFDGLLKIIDEFGLNGLVIGNLNKDYGSLDFREEAPAVFKGGLSGKPCTHLSTDLIYKTRATYGKRFTVIGVGGVMSPETAREKFDAGADLVQLITGMIFEGPGLVKKLCAARAEAMLKA